MRKLTNPTIEQMKAELDKGFYLISEYILNTDEIEDEQKDSCFIESIDGVKVWSYMVSSPINTTELIEDDNYLIFTFEEMDAKIDELLINV